MMLPQGNSCWLAPVISAMATGTVRMSFESVSVRAKRNSFHAAMKASRPVVTSAGHISGRKTWRTITKDEAPSTTAASSSSFGRSRMKVVSTQTVKGSVRIRFDSTSPGREL